MANNRRRLFRSLPIALLLFSFVEGSEAQSIRYMDESGNLHWVDSLDEVPFKYRYQVLRPTAVPTYRKGQRPHPTRRPKPTPRPKPRPPQKRPKVDRVPQQNPAFQRGQTPPPIYPPAQAVYPPQAGQVMPGSVPQQLPQQGQAAVPQSVPQQVPAVGAEMPPGHTEPQPETTPAPPVEKF